MDAMDAGSIFSNDDAFFEQAVRRHQDRRRAQAENYMYDPPSKICGGAVFAKLMGMGSSSKNHNKVFSLDTGFHKKQKKKDHKQRQQKQLQRQQQQQQQDDKMVNSLARKVMKRTKELSKEEHTENWSFKPGHVETTETTLSSLSEPSITMSAWLTEDDIFQQASISDDDPFSDDGEGRVMRESTGRHTNCSSQPRRRKMLDRQPSLKDLQSILKEMRDLNGMVKENSNVLQAGIENIAQEIRKTPRRGRRRQSFFQDEGDENDENCHHLDQWEGQGSTGTKGEADFDMMVDNDDMDEISKLKMDRNYYRSETETLRSEMQGIKEQLNELRKLLPQTPELPKSDAKTQENMPKSDAKTEENIPKPGAKTEEKIPKPDAKSEENPSKDEQGDKKQVEYEPTKTLAYAVASSMSRPGTKKENSKVTPLETIDNPHSSELKVSFRNEIREILSSQSESSPRASILKQWNRSTEKTRKLATMDIRRPPSPKVKDSTKEKPHEDKKESKGRSLSPARRQSTEIHLDPPGGQEKDVGVSVERNDLLRAAAKNFYQKQWEKSKPPCSEKSDLEKHLTNPRDPSEHRPATVEKPQEDDRSFLRADKKYREMRKSFRHSFTPKLEKSAGVEMTPKPRTEDAEDEYLVELRRSWYEKRGLVLKANSNSTCSDKSQDNAREKASSPKSIASSAAPSTKYHDDDDLSNILGDFK